MRRLPLIILVVLALATSAFAQSQSNVLSLTWKPVTFAQLTARPSQTNATAAYCADCQSSQICSAGGSGAPAYRIGNVWTCAPIGPAYSMFIGGSDLVLDQSVPPAVGECLGFMLEPITDIPAIGFIPCATGGGGQPSFPARPGINAALPPYNTGQGAADDSTAMSSACQFAISHHVNLYLPSTATGYKVTHSINCTTLNASQNLTVYGDGRILTTITHALVESYPVIDFSGCGRCGFEDAGITPAGGGSMATAGILSSKGNGAGSNGNGFRVTNAFVKAGNVAGDTAIELYNSDLARVTDSEISGGGAGVTLGNLLAANVTSKFVTINTSPDSTNLYLTRDEISGTNAPAIDYAGGAVLTLHNVYATLNGAAAANSKIVHISGSGGNDLYTDTLRTENQTSPPVALYHVYFDNASSAGVLTGTLSTASGDTAIGSASGANLANYVINTTASAGTMFALTGKLSGSVLYDSGMALFGSIGSGSSGNHVISTIPQTTIAAAIGAEAGLEVYYAGQFFRNANYIVVPPTDTAVFGRPSFQISSALVGAGGSYTGGGGEASINSYTLPIDVFQTWGGTGSGTTQNGTLEYLGYSASASAASGRIRVLFTQGANTAYVFDSGATIPANATGGIVGLRVTIKIIAYSSASLGTYAEALVNGVHYPNLLTGAGIGWTNLSASDSIAPGGGPITVTFLVTNTANAPYLLESRTLVVQ